MIGIGLGLLILTVIYCLAWLDILPLGDMWAGFNEEWPPIDDDEFMRRCPDGTSRKTALTVRRIVAEQLGVPYAQIYPEQRFVNNLHCD